MLFEKVINLKSLENSQEHVAEKLFVYKNVKCEVINVEFLSRDLPQNSSAIMVKWKCLKLLYSSKGMRWIDSQPILETPYTFFSILHSVGILVLRTLNTISSVFSGINNNNLSRFWLNDKEKIF